MTETSVEVAEAPAEPVAPRETTLPVIPKAKRAPKAATTLFEIHGELQAILDAVADGEGELPADLEGRWDAVQMAYDQKVQQTVLAQRFLARVAGAVREEAAAIEKVAASYDRQVAFLKGRIEHSMRLLGKTAAGGVLGKAWLQKNSSPAITVVDQGAVDALVLGNETWQELGAVRIVPERAELDLRALGEWYKQALQRAAAMLDPTDETLTAALSGTERQAYADACVGATLPPGVTGTWKSHLRTSA